MSLLWAIGGPGGEVVAYSGDTLDATGKTTYLAFPRDRAILYWVTSFGGCTSGDVRAGH